MGYLHQQHVLRISDHTVDLLLDLENSHATKLKQMGILMEQALKLLGGSSQDGRKWLITMVSFVPLVGLVVPLPNGLYTWLINGGDPNHLRPSWEPILQATTQPQRVTTLMESLSTPGCWSRNALVWMDGIKGDEV